VCLLSDAEVSEDVVEGVLGGDAATEDGVEGGDDGTEIFGHEVAGEVILEALDDKADVLECLVEHLLVADVGDEDTIGTLGGCGGDVDELLLEFLDAFAAEGGDS